RASARTWARSGRARQPRSTLSGLPGGVAEAGRARSGRRPAQTFADEVDQIRAPERIRIALPDEVGKLIVVAAQVHHHDGGTVREALRHEGFDFLVGVVPGHRQVDDSQGWHPGMLPAKAAFEIGQERVLLGHAPAERDGIAYPDDA